MIFHTIFHNLTKGSVSIYHRVYYILYPTTSTCQKLYSKLRYLFAYPICWHELFIPSTREAYHISRYIRSCPSSIMQAAPITGTQSTTIGNGLYKAMQLRANVPWKQGSWGQHGTHQLGPCWPREFCYLGILANYKMCTQPNKNYNTAHVIVNRA